MNNKLYCTFTNTKDIDIVVNKIQSSYVILFVISLISLGLVNVQYNLLFIDN